MAFLYRLQVSIRAGANIDGWLDPELRHSNLSRAGRLLR